MTTMPTTKHQAAWNICLDVIRSEVTSQSYRTWFEPIKPAKLENKVLTIEVPSTFFYEWLEAYYLQILRKAIVKALGQEGKLEYSMVVDQGMGQNKPFMMNIRNGQQEARPQPRSREATRNQPAFAPAQPAQPVVASQLIAQYTFDSFIEGDCNRFARSAGISIANRPGQTAFNPFVIYGGVGLGKTHLAHAIGNEILENNPEKVIRYTSTEQFTQQFIEALKSNRVQDFTNMYLSMDVLIVDDIQFLSKKEKTQETFFHIFNYLHQSGKQIILTCDTPPKDITGFQERLLSRFKWGLTADLQSPDYETRFAIAQVKVQSEGLKVPDDVLDYIATQVNSNIRELEGVLISLIANASLTRKDIDMQLAKTTLLNLVKNTKKEITIEFIQELVADYFKISVQDIKGKTRKKEIAQARQIAMYLSQQYTKQPLKIIGEQFGGRDHSTVVHAGKTVTKKSSEDRLYSKILEEVKSKMKAD